jgi:transcriptional regulator of arginine metabolism
MRYIPTKEDTMRRSKADRLDALRRLLGDKEVGDQIEITNHLKEMGYKVTQATVSRDLLELGAARVSVRPGVHRYQVISETNTADVRRRLEIAFRDSVEEIKMAGNLMLIRTTSGAASGVAHAFDQYGFQDVVGTVAGDDTILAVCTTEEACTVLRNKLLPVLGNRF